MMLVPVSAETGTPASSVPVRFSFDNLGTVHIEFGFTRNAVTDMGTAITDASLIELAETKENSRVFEIPHDLFAYWRLLAATDYNLSLRHTGYLDDAESIYPQDIIPFTLFCGSDVIPANQDTIIMTHTGSIEPTVQSMPISVQATSDKLNASVYIATLTLTLTTIE